MPLVEKPLFRIPYGEQDAAALAAVQAGRVAQDLVDPLSIVEGLPDTETIRVALAQAAASQQLDRWRVAEIGGQVVGYGNLGSWHEEDGRWVYLIRGWVLPGWRGQGIGTALLHWGEDRVRQLAAAEHPGALFEFAGSASNSEPDAAALLQAEGYSVGYHEIEMELDPAAVVPESLLPPRVEIRPAAAEHIHAIAESIAESYRSEFPSNRFRDTHSEIAGQFEWYSNPLHDRSLWQVAWDGERVVGQVLPLLDHGRVVIDEVSVRPAWRRRGLARTLLTSALRALRSRDYRVIRLYTTAEFPTRASELYASVGFKVVKTFRQFRKSPG
jgi:mycothiol synthase